MSAMSHRIVLLEGTIAQENRPVMGAVEAAHGSLRRRAGGCKKPF